MGINHFIDTMLEALGSMDLSTLEPMSNFIFHPLFDREWIERIEEVMRKVEEYNLPLEQAAKHIKGIAHLRCQLFFLLLDLKSANISIGRRMKLASFFHELLELKAQGDVYGKQSNIAHSPEEVELILRKPFQPATEEIARLLGRLYAASYHLVNGLYTDFYTDYSAENMGAYPLSDGRILVIKHFEDVRPSLLWDTKTPCKRLTIYCIYEQVRFTCDAVSCHSRYEGDPIRGLKSYLVEADEIPIKDLQQIEKIKGAIESLAVEQWKKLVQQNKEELKQKGVFMRCYVFKDLFELVGMDWRPTSAMLEAVKGKELAINFWNPPVENQQEYWRRILDPAEEVYR